MCTGIYRGDVMQDKQDNFSRIKDKWQEIMLHVKEDHELSDISYNTWLTKIQPFAMEKNKLTIVGPDSMFLNYIKKKYSKLEVKMVKIY